MSDLRRDIEPARFALRAVRRKEIIDGDPRTLALELGRGNHAYVFALTEDEARGLLLLLADQT